MRILFYLLCIVPWAFGVPSNAPNYSYPNNLDHEKQVHPGYSLMTIRPTTYNNIWPHQSSNGFMAPAVGLSWGVNPDELLVLTWRGDTGPYSNGKTGNHARDGRLYKLTNVKGVT